MTILSRRERGSAAIEMAILMPVFLALFTAAVVIGRTANVTSAVEAAAYDAARTASLARDAATAQADAYATVQQRLADRGVECVDGPQVVIPPEPFDVPVGEPASVTATVTCVVSYVDVDIVGVPGDQSIEASFVSPIDQYRSRS
jgi:hypothetical protein